MGLRQKDDGGIELTRPIIENYRCRTYTPLAGEERDSDKRTMGYRVNKTDHRKIIAAGPIPPLAGEERDSGERTMGWSEDDLNENG